MREKTSNICRFLTPSEICQVLAENKMPNTIPREEREKRWAVCQLLMKIKDVIFMQKEKKEDLLRTFARNEYFVQMLVDAIIYSESKTVTIIISKSSRPRYKLSVYEKMISLFIPLLEEDW